ncbi:Uncharacterised protein [Vibrio cholerae]|nr:Uncharacterised protein [Vibrio cholerae]
MILLKDRYDFIHGFFAWRIHAFQWIFFAHGFPFVCAKFVVRQQLNFLDVFHVFNKLTQLMSRCFIIGVTWNHHVTQPSFLTNLMQVARKI